MAYDTVGHTIGSYQPFISANLYKLTVIDLVENNNRGYCDYKLIELKVSVGDLGEIYEDGFKNKLASTPKPYTPKDHIVHSRCTFCSVVLLVL